VRPNTEAQDPRAKQKKNGAARNITNSNDAEDADASAAARKVKLEVLHLSTSFRACEAAE
jgi:hypothetical protein